jgi:nitronate monooxygenase
MVDHAGAPAGYPEINNATRPLRAAAAGKGDTERMSLWAGQGYRDARDRPAGEIIAWLSGDGEYGEDDGADPEGIGGRLP